MKENNDRIYFHLGQALIRMNYIPVYLSKDQIETVLFVSEKENIVFTISIEFDNDKLLLSEGALFERWNKISNGIFCLSEISSCDYTNTDKLFSQFTDSIDSLIKHSREFLDDDKKAACCEMQSGIVIAEPDNAINRFANDNQYTISNFVSNGHEVG